MYWDNGWWSRPRYCNAWMYWADPYSHIRVSGNWYIYERPSPSHGKVLLVKGWVFKTGNPEYFLTLDANLAKETMELLNLPFLESNSCHKVYWNELTYFI